MTGRIRDADIAEVRSRVRIDEVIAEHVTLRPAGGGSYKGLCPFHDERSPSFHVTPSKGLYHCFGCQAGGDAITFLMNLQGLTFAEAVEKLASRTGVQLRYEGGGTAPNQDRGQRARLIAANQAAAQWYAERLLSDQGARARGLLASRGFDEQALQHFGVGYAPDSWDGLISALRAQGYGSETLLAAGLVSQGTRGSYDRFRGRLIWPIRDLGGDVVGFGARRLDDNSDSPKYLNTPETVLYKKSQVLYGLDLARKTISKSQQVVVVEGYTDVMAAHLAGVTNAVATCGTAFAAEHIAVLRRILLDDGTSQGQVVFTFDSDAAGQQAALRAFESDQQFLTATYVAVEPSGLDPADLRLAHGDQAVRDLIERRVPLFEFALRSAIAGVDITTVEGRTAGMRKVVPIIAGIRDLAIRPEYARVAAGWLGLPEETLAAQVRAGTRPRARGPGEPDKGTAASTDLPPGLEREVLRAVLHCPTAVHAWLETVEPSALDHVEYRAVYTTLLAVGEIGDQESEPEWIQRVLAGAPDDRQRRTIRALATEPMPISGTDPDSQARYAVSLLARLYDRDAARRMDAVTAALAQPEATRNPDRRRQLQHEYRDLANLRQQLQPMLTAEG